jgi:hypothetical protein
MKGDNAALVNRSESLVAVLVRIRDAAHRFIVLRKDDNPHGICSICRNSRGSAALIWTKGVERFARA